MGRRRPPLTISTVAQLSPHRARTGLPIPGYPVDLAAYLLDPSRQRDLLCLRGEQRLPLEARQFVQPCMDGDPLQFGAPVERVVLLGIQLAL